MPPWVGAGLKLLLALVGWGKREEEKSDDFKIARGADLEQTHASDVRAQENRERVHRMPDDDLNDSLRQDGAGGTRSGQ